MKEYFYIDRNDGAVKRYSIDGHIAVALAPGPGSVSGTQGPAGPQGPQGDPGPAGTAQIKEIEISFGQMARREQVFVIVDAAVTPSSRIVAAQSGAPASGQQADNGEMDALAFRCAPKAGAFELFATVVSGFKVLGSYRVNYIVG